MITTLLTGSAEAQVWRNITFYSCSNSSCEYVKHKLVAQLDELGLDFNIVEVTDRAEIMDKGIKSLPAVGMDEEVIEIGKVDIVTYASKITRLLRNKIKRPMKPTIIVPVDFSESSKNATDFATNLASQLGADFMLLHVQRVEISDDSYFDSDKMVDSIQRELMDDELERVKEVLEENNKDSRIEAAFRTGFAAEQIVAVAENTPNSIIVMGTTGSNSRIKKIIGSVSTSVASKSTCPVFLVPPSSKRRTMKNLLYSAKDSSLDVAVLDQLVLIAEAADAHIQVINMSRDPDYDEIGMISVLRENYPKNKLSFTHLHEKGNTSTLIAHADEHDIDAIVVTTKSRSPLEKLFHNSFSFKMGIETNVPLLILHKRQK